MLRGRLVGGSLDLLARSFVESRLHLDTLGPLFGEFHFGRATQVVLGGIEGVLFGSCIAGALALMCYLQKDSPAPWKI